MHCGICYHEYCIANQVTCWNIMLIALNSVWLDDRKLEQGSTPFFFLNSTIQIQYDDEAINNKTYCLGCFFLYCVFTVHQRDMINLWPHLLFSVDKHISIPFQVKRCAEMSRKLRFFSDQINRAGVRSSVRPALEPDIDLEELEVHYSSFLEQKIFYGFPFQRLLFSMKTNSLLEWK